MGEVVDDFAARGVEADDVTAELEHIWWVSIARQVTDTDPRYGQHDGTGLRAAAEGYAAADREHLTETARRTRVEAAAWHRSVGDGNRAAAAMLRAEADRTARPMSLRGAFEASAPLLLGAAPCWAMSPLVVGEALPPGSWFDVVVVVGAGSLTTAAAVSALSRGRQVVAVGDAETSWPTGFTAGPGVVGEDEAPTRSLLEDLAEALPTHRLRWAHAYRDPRLLLVAGGGYAGELVGPPSPVLEATVGLELVDGRAGVEPGEDTTIDSTDAEVDRVVGLVLDHARHRRDESLGVIALTERHAERIRWALAAAAGALDAAPEPDVLAYLDAEAARPVAVVSLAAAAGLARDAVVLSVGYGKTPHGRVLHRFPALSAPDAPRRLRAALTAARRRLTVVSSIGPDDLDENRLRDGAVALRDLLRSAMGGSLETVDEAPVAPDPLMIELAARLRREGLVVAERVGTGPHRVDLALTVPAHPERWLLAVDGDGPEYATWRGTRERDRLWPQGLERRGWRHLRVWSTDLYRDPARDVARIVSMVREEARAVGVPVPAPVQAETVEGEPEAFTEPTEPRSGRAEPTHTEPTHTEPTHTEPPHTEPGSTAGPEAAAEGSSRRRRRAVRRGTSEVTDPAGQTTDDTDVGWGERRDESAHDQWLRNQRPPHWD